MRSSSTIATRIPLLPSTAEPCVGEKPCKSSASSLGATIGMFGRSARPHREAKGLSVVVFGSRGLAKHLRGKLFNPAWRPGVCETDAGRTFNSQ